MLAINPWSHAEFSGQGIRMYLLFVSLLHSEIGQVGEIPLPGLGATNAILG